MDTKRMDVTEVLQKTALFSSLSQSEVQSLAAKTVRKILGAGEFLFHEGDACKGFHIVSRGQVRLFKASASGREQVLAVNVAGESVAEIPVFDDGPYPASAVAIEETEIAFISRKDFREYCVAHPEVGLKVLAFVGARLRRLVAIIEELSFTTTRQRLVAVLVRGRFEGTAKVAPLISHAIPATSVLIAALSGYFLWKEYEGADFSVKVRLGLMFVLLAAGIGAISAGVPAAR